MNQTIRDIIKNNHMINQYLKEESYEYQYLYRDASYIKKIEKHAKRKYHGTGIDKITRLKNNLDFINTFMSVLE